MPTYIVFPEPAAAPLEVEAFVVTGSNLRAAMEDAASRYDLAGNWRVERLGEDKHTFAVANNVSTRTVTVLDE